jgi:hypothetical protein
MKAEPKIINDNILPYGFSNKNDEITKSDVFYDYSILNASLSVKLNLGTL